MDSKNGKPCYVPLLGELAELIERRREAKHAFSNLVFHCDGVAIADSPKRRRIRNDWEKAAKKANVPGTLFHDLRRSSARNLIRSGVSRNVAKMVGGCKTDSMFDRYNVTAEEDLRDAMEKVTQYNATEAKKVVAIGKRR